MRAAALLLALPLAAASAPPAITADGWGPLRIGMSRAAVERAAGRDSHPEAVGGPDPATCDEFHPARTPAGVIVMVEDGRVTRVAVTRRGLASDRGIRVGDTAAKVRTAYRRQNLADKPHQYVDAPARYLTWMRDRDRGIVYEINERDRVAAILAGGRSIRYVEGCL